jgi:hypothetical protein
MKTFSDDALAALERGDAIVSASVEILTGSLIPKPFNAGDTVEVSWQQNTFVQVGGNDEARMGIAFFDASRSQIGSTTWSTLTQPTTWTARTVSDTVPSDCCFIRIYQDRQRIAGINNDGYIDSIGLTIDGAAIAVVNGGAETGDGTGWAVTLGALIVQNDTIGAPGTPVPADGAYYFSGGNYAQSTAYQEFSNGFESISGTPIRLWGGYGDADLPSDAGTSTFKGIGDRGLIQSSSGAIGGTAQNTTLGLSGIEAAALDVLDEVKEASVVVRRLIYDSAGKTLLGAYVYSRGRLDELKTSEVIGGAAAIQVSVEGAARGLGRRGGRLRSDADQRLVSSSDGFFRNVSFAAQKTLYWGGKKPAKFG